jgi:hypothetical protein
VITAHDIENARRLWIAARGTPDEDRARASLELLVEQAKREHRIKKAS